MNEATEAAVRRFIVDQFLFGQDHQGPAVDDSLLGKGVIDSTGVLEIVGFLETSFGINIEDEEMIPTNLGSIERIVRFVERKRAA